MLPLKLANKRTWQPAKKKKQPTSGLFLFIFSVSACVSLLWLASKSASRITEQKCTHFIFFSRRFAWVLKATKRNDVPMHAVHAESPQQFQRSCFFLFHVRKLLSFRKAASWKSQLTIKKGSDLSIGAVISLQFSPPYRRCRTAERKTTTKQQHKATCVKTVTERVVSTGYRPAAAADETTLLIRSCTLEDKKNVKGRCSKI